MSEQPDPSVARRPARRPRLTVRDEYKALTRQRLVDAAFEEFADKGYAQCTVEDIARRAGTSRATFYAHFAGKLELADGMWEVTRRPLVALYRDLARTEVRDAAALEAWLRRTFAWYEGNRARLTAIHEAITLEDEMSEAYLERVSEVAALVAPLVREEHINTERSAWHRAALLTLQHERFCFFWILRRMPFDPDEAVHALVDVWVEAVGNS
ncbi:TetR/AcrR family transcriptional regulator [Blastococcus sp. SYSU D00669]